MFNQRITRLGVHAGLLVWAAVAMASSIEAADYVPQGYRAVEIAGLEAQNGRARLNNNRQVVFSKYEDYFDGDSTEIYYWEGNQLTRLTEDNRADFEPDINDQGTIVWCHAKGNRGSKTVIMIRYPDGRTEELTRPDDQIEVRVPHINNRNHVVWQEVRNDHQYGGNPPKYSVVYYDGQTIRHISLQVSGEAQSPSINDLDQIVWNHDPVEDSKPNRVMRWLNGRIDQLSVDKTGDIFSLALSISNQGLVPMVFRRSGRGPLGQELTLQGLQYYSALTSQGVHELRFGDIVNPYVNNTYQITFSVFYEKRPSDDTRRHGQYEAWLYTENGAFIQLTDTPEDYSEFPTDINDLGDVALNKSFINEQGELRVGVILLQKE